MVAEESIVETMTAKRKSSIGIQNIQRLSILFSLKFQIPKKFIAMLSEIVA
jgi:hypothetical protein